MLHTRYSLVILALLTSFSESAAIGAGRSHYTKLAPVVPKVIAATESWPGGGFRAENILRPWSPRGKRAEYATRGQGEKTFIDFDFGQPTSVQAFQFIQRDTSDTIAESDLIFSDQRDFASEIQRVRVEHVDKPAAVTFASFPEVKARFVRWQVAKVLPERSKNTGGQFLQFLQAAGGADERPTKLQLDMRQNPIVKRGEGEVEVPVHVTIDSPYAEEISADVKIGDEKPRKAQLAFGEHSFEVTRKVSPANSEPLAVSVSVAGRVVVQKESVVDPQRVLTVYILPHSHTDIGYTAIQTDIEEKQVNNLLVGMAEAERTANYPEGARFVWNVEVTWAADLFLQRMPEPQRTAFFEAVRSGKVALNGMYLNELTGLCRPQELIQLFRFATQLAGQTGVPIESAMISDVPGYTWGTVAALNQAGIRYLSAGPNYFDRIGDILDKWENRPFWWVAPDGKSRVLVWIPYRGYALAGMYGKLSETFVNEYCEGLRELDYPFNIAYLRWAGHGDNAAPDPTICDFVRDWNATHVSPRFIISSTDTAFRAFEEQYGDKLPEVRGDWTPYWEDGAGSSAAETALNRASSDRLTQAQALWAMQAPHRYPVEKFEEAWKNTLLYSEHTWGAHCSISLPAIPFTLEQWDVKKSYATTANLQSRQLLSAATQSPTATSSEQDKPIDTDKFVDIYNTTSWPRTELAFVPRELSRAGDAVIDEDGEPVPSQRLANDELAILVKDLAPFSGRRYAIVAGRAAPAGDAVKVSDAVLDNGRIRVQLDAIHGGIAELKADGIKANFADTESGNALNDYLYFVGENPKDAQVNGQVTIKPRDKGPLVASLLVTSEAPGCWNLEREVRVVADGDYVELLNTVDKRRLEAQNYHEAKESLNFAFPLNVPNGTIRLDVPLGVMRPEEDQIASACKNWFTVGRWADVANDDYGATWVTLDAPLVQLGGLTATLLNSQSDPYVWRKQVEPTQKLYSWAMNNHWGTNYRAFQEGPAMFRFVLRPHRGSHDDAEATRFATGFSQPLATFPGRGQAPSAKPLLNVEPATVVVIGLKPSDDGKAMIVRLLNVSDKEQPTKLAWSREVGQATYSGTSEEAGQPVDGAVVLPARGLATLRVETE